MGMSTHVVGFHPPDERWKKMKAVYDACMDANIDVPYVVKDFFDYHPPCKAGVMVNLEDHVCCSEHSDDGQSGFHIDLNKLPANIKSICFYNSW